MRIEADSAVTSLALFGVAADGQIAAELPAAPAEGEALLPGDIAADLGVTSGDTVSVNGQELTVTGTVATQWYSHSPVGYVHVDTFRALADQAEDTAGSALLVREDAAADGAIDQAAASSGTRAVSVFGVAAGPALLLLGERLADPHPGLPLRHLRPGHDRLPVRVDDPAHP